MQDAIDKQQRMGKPVRILILKYRQGGFSTHAAANIFRHCRFVGGTYMVVSMDLDSAEHIFSIYQRFHHYLPSHETKNFQTVASNRKELKFSEPHGGRIIVETAGKSSAGHSFTLSGLHLSEVSRWPEDTEDAVAGLLNSVPDAANTMVIIESVANGMSGWFHQEWNNKDSVYEKIFVPWYDQEEYTMSALPMEEGKYFANMSEEEKQILAQYDLTLEQIEWRRYTIKNKLQDKKEKFREQYPANPREAFLSSGNNFFDVEALAKIETCEPLVGELRKFSDITGEDIRFVVNKNANGRLWRRVQKDHEYVIGVDVAEGLEIEGAPQDDRHDYSSVDVLDRDTGEQVFHFHARVTPDELGRQLSVIGAYYNHAYIGIETNAGYGTHTLDTLLNDENYPMHMVYRRMEMDGQTRRPTKKLGWTTTKANRKSIMSNLDMAVRHGEVLVSHQDSVDEMYSFIVKPDGRIEAGTGKKDDRVFSLAIAFEMLESAPPRSSRSRDSDTAELPVIKYRHNARLLANA